MLNTILDQENAVDAWNIYQQYKPTLGYISPHGNVKFSRYAHIGNFCTYLLTRIGNNDVVLHALNMLHELIELGYIEKIEISYMMAKLHEEHRDTVDNFINSRIELYNEITRKVDTKSAMNI